MVHSEKDNTANGTERNMKAYQIRATCKECGKDFFPYCSNPQHENQIAIIGLICDKCNGQQKLTLDFEVNNQ